MAMLSRIEQTIADFAADLNFCALEHCEDRKRPRWSPVLSVIEAALNLVQ